MDSVVQNIKLSDILPSNFQTYNNHEDIMSLANSIKEYGILEPLLLRPKSGKYEIILGNKRYQAAKMLNLETVPALIKNVDDDVFEEYKKINEMQTKFLTQEEEKENYQAIPNNSRSEKKVNSLNTINLELESDIVNLEELNKKEEREDFKMNNEQYNNMNNNLGVNNVGTNNLNNNTSPTFGGRFFPSLEDEPTNMNMGGSGIITTPIMNTTPNSNQNNTGMSTNNLIDLTDTNNDFSSSIPNNNSFANPTSTLIQPEPILNNNIDNAMYNLNNIPLQNGNLVSPEINTTPLTPVTPINNLPQDLIQDFGAPLASNGSQYGMPNLSLNNYNNLADTNGMSNGMQNNYPSNIEQAIPEPQMVQAINPMQMNDSMASDMPNISSMASEPAAAPELQAEGANQNFPQKEVKPVVDTIKGVVSNLESFGYKISTMDEDNLNSYKIIIEVEK